MGFGTEKVEERFRGFSRSAGCPFGPGQRDLRKGAFSAIIADFEARRTDILVGTQMITKGFDFGVSLVGILNADNLLNNPDFRAAERAFQLMMAGRAGRRDDGGEVVIQTSEPGHPVIRQVAAGDFEGWPAHSSPSAKPFSIRPMRGTSLTLRHRDPFGAPKRGHGPRRTPAHPFRPPSAGAETSPVDRIRGEYLVGLLLKIESGASASRPRTAARTGNARCRKPGVSNRSPSSSMSILSDTGPRCRVGCCSRPLRAVCGEPLARGERTVCTLLRHGAADGATGEADNPVVRGCWAWSPSVRLRALFLPRQRVAVADPRLQIRRAWRTARDGRVVRSVSA